jgi:hypothetical protein
VLHYAVARQAIRLSSKAMKATRSRMMPALVRVALIYVIVVISSKDSLAQEVDPMLPFLTQSAGAISLHYPEGVIAIAYQDIQSGGSPTIDEQRAIHLATIRMASFFQKQKNFENVALSGVYPIWTKRFSIGSATYLRVVVGCCELLPVHQLAILAMLDARWPEAERNFGVRLIQARTQDGSPRSVMPSVIAPMMTIPTKEELLTPLKPAEVDR